MSTPQVVTINRAPVLTLWAAIVAERLGFARDEAFTLGKAVAGLNAYSKGRALGLFEPSATSVAAVRKKMQAKRRAGAFDVALLQRAVPVVPTTSGLRAYVKGKAVDPIGVKRYLKSKFGAALDETERAMRVLADSRSPARLAAEAYSLYEAFRPEIPAGTAGWGAAGALELKKLRALARRTSEVSARPSGARRPPTRPRQVLGAKR